MINREDPKHLTWVAPLAFTGMMAIANVVWFFSGDHAASAELNRRVTTLEQWHEDESKQRQEMALRLARMEPILELIKEKLIPTGR